MYTKDSKSGAAAFAHPIIQIKTDDRTGDYRLQFSKEMKYDFYGKEISQAQAFLFYGDMPDNQILTNKLINNLGKNLLALEKDALEIRSSPSMTASLKEKLLRYSEMERESNAFTIRVFDALSSLDQARLYDPKHKDAASSQAAIKAMTAEIEKNNQDLIGKINTKTQQIEDAIKEIKQQQQSLRRGNHSDAERILFGALESKLHQLQADLDSEKQKKQRITEELASLEDKTPEEIQKLYRGTLSNRVFSLYEERRDRIKKQIDQLDKNKPEEKIKIDELAKLLDVMFNNQIATFSALNDSSTNIHSIYRKVMKNFSDEQQLISVYQHRADRFLTYANRSLTDGYQNASYAMEQHVFSYQCPTDEQLWKEMAADEDIEIDTANYPSMRKEDALYSACCIAKDRAKKQKNPLQVIQRIFDAAKETIASTSLQNRKGITIPSTNPAGTFNEFLDSLSGSASEPAVKSQFKRVAAEQEVHLYQNADLFSAIGMACMDVGKYLESEMGAKKPVLTMATFIAMSATFGAAGLAAAGVSSMNGAVHILSQILTLNGKLGSVANCQSIINSISNQWLSLTYSNGSLFHVIIMNGIALPKISFLIFDALFNSSEHKDLLTQMIIRFGTQDLAGTTDAEKATKMAKNTMIAAALIVTAIGLGLGAEQLTALSGAAHGVGTVVTSLVDAPLQAFTALGPAAASIPGEMIAIFSLLLTVKSAALFLGKMALVLNHMDIVDEDANAACLFIAGLKDVADHGLKENFTPEQKEKAAQHFEKFQRVLKEKPGLAQYYGPDFLKQIGITIPKPPLYVTAATALGNGAKTVFVDYLFKGTFIATLQVVGGALGTMVGLGWLYPDKFGMHEGFLRFVNSLTKLGLGAVGVLKSLTTSTWGTLQRMTMATLDGGFSMGLCLNYIGGNLIRMNPLKAGLGLLIAPVKIGLAITSLATEVLHAAVVITKHVISPVVGVLTGLINGIVSASRSEGFIKGFKEGFNLPYTGFDLVRDYGVKSIKNGCASASHFLDKELLQAPGGSTIERWRNNSLNWLSNGFNDVKGFLGEIAYQARSLVVRNQEDRLQKFRQEQDEKISGLIEERVADMQTADVMVGLGAGSNGNGHKEDVVYSVVNGTSPSTTPKLSTLPTGAKAPEVRDDADDEREGEGNPATASI